MLNENHIKNEANMLSHLSVYVSPSIVSATTSGGGGAPKSQARTSPHLFSCPKSGNADEIF